MRKTLEREANALGIPWTNQTSSDDLRAVIQSKMESESMPKVELPACFGVWWENVPGGNESCLSCGAAQECLVKFTDDTLPSAESVHGADVNAMGDMLEVKPEAITAAIDFRLQSGKAPLTPDLEPEDEPEKVDPEPEAVTEQVDEMPQTKKKKAPTKKKKAVAKKKVTQKEVVPAEPVETPEKPEVKKAAKKKASKKEVSKKAVVADIPEKSGPEVKKPSAKKTSKKVAPKKKEVSKKGPTKATSAKSATGVATRKTKKSNAKVAEAQADQGKGKREPWGVETFHKRWTRERERSPLIAATLLPGMKHTVEWPEGSKKKHTVTVKQGRYEYQGEAFPTLYKLSQHITKRVTWSGARFWKLHKLQEVAQR